MTIYTNDMINIDILELIHQGEIDVATDYCDSNNRGYFGLCIGEFDLSLLHDQRLSWAGIAGNYRAKAHDFKYESWQGYYGYSFSVTGVSMVGASK